MWPCVIYLLIGGVTACVAYLNKRKSSEITLGYPPGLFTMLEYFILVTCWPGVLILIVGVITVRMIKDKIL
jgi:hypothetical protein